jgi:hypothetical protein
VRDIIGTAQRDSPLLLVDVLKVCKDDLVQGAMISVTENGARIKRLPLLR